jgi:hypothetical protein
MADARVDRFDGNAICVHCSFWEAPTAASPVLRGNTLSRCLQRGGFRAADDTCAEWLEYRRDTRPPNPDMPTAADALRYPEMRAAWRAEHGEGGAIADG